jgi:iron complex outermembrane receptor protein
MAQSGSSISIGKRRLALALCCLLAGAARGQSLDYQTLEGMFDEPVTTSATGKPERLSDTPTTMDIITQDDIKRSGARDLATLLRLLPGVITYRGQNGSEPFSLGALLLNGREIYVASFGQTYLDSIPVELEEIRQIEVVQGPQSGLYGFNSGEGVINIITFDPARDPIDFARLRGGSESLRDGAASVTLNPADDVGVRLTAATDHERQSGFDAPRGMNLPAINLERRSFSANASAYLPDDSHATFEVAHSDVSLPTTVPEATLRVNARLQEDAVKGDYTIDTAIGRLGALLSYSSMTVPDAQTYLNSRINLHDHTTDGRLNDVVKLSPDDSVRAEFEARDETVHSANSPEPVSTLMLAGSAMWDHRFSDALSMVNGVRYFRGDIEQVGPALVNGDFHYQPHGWADNTSLVYKLDAEDSVRGSFARGLSVPSELDFAQLGLTSTSAKGESLAGGPTLSTWTNSEARFTYDHQFRAEGISLRASLFEQQSDNVMALSPFELLASALPTCNPPTIRTVKTCRALVAGDGLSGTAQGLELELEHKSPMGVTWGGNYTLERLQPHQTPDAAFILPSIGREQTLQKANAHFGYGWDAWTADIRLLYTSPTPTLTLDTLGRIPAVAIENSQNILTLSPRMGWQPADYVSIELSAENLWPYRINPLEKVDSLYYLTLRLTY